MKGSNVGEFEYLYLHVKATDEVSGSIYKF